MSRIKLSEICNLPEKLSPNPILLKLCNCLFPEFEQEYIQSSSNKTEIKDIVPILGVMGENEKSLYYKLWDNGSNTIFLYGGIGVGKSTFLNYFRYKILEDHHNVINEYIDCTPLKTKKNLESYEKLFNDIFCERIENIINKYIKFKEQLEKTWDEIIEHDKKINKLNDAFVKISNLVNIKNAYTVDERTEIHQFITESHMYRDWYYARMLKYIIQNKINDNKKFYLIIDNLDQESEELLDNIKYQICIFGCNSDARIIVAVRKSTYCRHFESGANITATSEKYSGILPYNYLIYKINEFITKPEKFENVFSNDEYSTISNSLSLLSKNFLKHPIFKKVFSSLCGHNIRRCKIISKNIIHNCIYDLTKFNEEILSINDEHELHFYDMLRALIVGTEQAFSWSSQGSIENIFELQETANVNHLIKIRILDFINKSAELKDEKKRTINELKDYLKGYDYTNLDIYIAINQLMDNSKRLIWNDNVITFKDENDMNLHPNSNCIITDSGIKHIENLFGQINYVQEMLISSYVETDPNYFGKSGYKEDNDDIYNIVIKRNGYFGTYYRLVEQRERFILLLHFCKYLFSIDSFEVGLFVNNNRNKDIYLKSFRSEKFITHSMISEIANSIDKILSVIISRNEHIGKTLSEFINLKKYLEGEFLSLLKLSSNISNLKNYLD